MVTFFIFAAVTVISCWPVGCFSPAPMEESFESQLHNNLLANYTNRVRPVTNFTDKIAVKFDFKLKQIVKLDIKNQELHIKAFILMEWQDIYIRWRSASYGGVDVINIEPNKIWTPDIMLHNSAAEESVSHLDIYKSFVTANHEGNLVWMTAVKTVTSCEVDITWFPFDTQTCSLSFGSWADSNNRLAIEHWEEEMGTTAGKHHHHVESGEWHTLSFTRTLTNVTYPCCATPYSIVTYTIRMRRMPRFYLLYLILPCLAVTFLFLLSSFIPPDCGERMGFGVTILLSLSVYLLVISDQLPQKSDSAPMIGILYTIVFFTLCCGLVFSTIGVILSSKNEPMPKKIGAMLHWMRPQRQHVSGIHCDGCACPSKTDGAVIDWTIEWKLLAKVIDRSACKFFSCVFVAVPIVVSILYATSDESKD